MRSKSCSFITWQRITRRSHGVDKLIAVYRFFFNSCLFLFATHAPLVYPTSIPSSHYSLRPAMVSSIHWQRAVITQPESTSQFPQGSFQRKEPGLVLEVDLVPGGTKETGREGHRKRKSGRKIGKKSGEKAVAFQEVEGYCHWTASDLDSVNVCIHAAALSHASVQTAQDVDAALAKAQRSVREWKFKGERGRDDWWIEVLFLNLSWVFVFVYTHAFLSTVCQC